MQPRHVHYKVTYANRTRYVWSNGELIGSIHKDGKHFHAGGAYHRTLRDAIIYLAYGV